MDAKLGTKTLKLASSIGWQPQGSLVIGTAKARRPFISKPAGEGAKTTNAPTVLALSISSTATAGRGTLSFCATELVS